MDKDRERTLREDNKSRTGQSWTQNKLWLWYLNKTSHVEYLIYVLLNNFRWLGSSNSAPIEGFPNQIYCQSSSAWQIKVIRFTELGREAIVVVTLSPFTKRV